MANLFGSGRIPQVKSCLRGGPSFEKALTGSIRRMARAVCAELQVPAVAIGMRPRRISLCCQCALRCGKKFNG
jgi:hypothetical protein